MFTDISRRDEQRLVQYLLHLKCSRGIVAVDDLTADTPVSEIRKIVDKPRLAAQIGQWLRQKAEERN